MIFFSSELFLFTIVLLLLAAFYLLIRKRTTTEKIFVYESFVLCFFILIVIIPFYKGEKLNSYFDTGINLVNKIETYKTSKVSLPKTLDDLSPVYMPSEQCEFYKPAFRYSFIDHVERNKKYKKTGMKILMNYT